MGGRRTVALLVVTALALAGCSFPDAPGEEFGAPGADQNPVVEVVEGEPLPAGDATEEPATAGGELAWAGYDPAYGAASSQVLGSAVAGVGYLVRAVCVSEAPLDLWFDVSVNQVPTAEASVACTGTPLVTQLGELPEGAVVTVNLSGDVELAAAASVLVLPADG